MDEELSLALQALIDAGEPTKEFGPYGESYPVCFYCEEQMIHFFERDIHAEDCVYWRVVTLYHKVQNNDNEF